jgi:hypothetical protein
LLVLPAVAAAQLREQPVFPLEGVSIAFENDMLSGRNATDRWYTNGLQLAGSYKPGREPDIVRPVSDWTRRWLWPVGCAGTDCELRVTAALGQSMYTPRDIGVAQWQPRDRPWAAWLYAGVGLSSFAGNRHQMFGLKAGPTGPAALGEPAQSFVHEYISHSPQPQGWAHQVRPRLGVQVSYLSTHRFRLFERLGWQASWGGTLGNLRTLARVGLALTWSADARRTAGELPGGLDEGEFFVPDHPPDRHNDGSLRSSLRRTVLYAHAQASAIAYNAFLQARTYAGRPQVDLRHGVATTTVGVSVPFGSRGRHRLGLAWKRRSPEFTAQGTDGRDAWQRWGVVTYSWAIGG